MYLGMDDTSSILAVRGAGAGKGLAARARGALEVCESPRNTGPAAHIARYMDAAFHRWRHDLVRALSRAAQQPSWSGIAFRWAADLSRKATLGPRCEGR